MASKPTSDFNCLVPGVQMGKPGFETNSVRGKNKTQMVTDDFLLLAQPERGGFKQDYETGISKYLLLYQKHVYNATAKSN